MSRTNNSGIQGTNISIRAGALAVGHAAKAVSFPLSSRERRELNEAVDPLLAAIDALPLQPAARVAIADDVTHLSMAVKGEPTAVAEVSSSLASIAAKLSQFGIIATQVASLIEPMKTITALARASIQGLGS